MKLTLDYEPTAKGVPRVRFVNGHALTYYHKNTTEGLEAIRAMLYNKHLKPFPEHTPVKMDVTFYRTKSKWYRPKSEKLPCRKPDTTNFLKLLEDCLSGIIIPDDAAITTIIARKRWTKLNHGYIEITLEQDSL